MQNGTSKIMGSSTQGEREKDRTELKLHCNKAKYSLQKNKWANLRLHCDYISYNRRNHVCVTYIVEYNVIQSKPPTNTLRFLEELVFKHGIRTLFGERSRVLTPPTSCSLFSVVYLSTHSTEVRGSWSIKLSNKASA